MFKICFIHNPYYYQRCLEVICDFSTSSVVFIGGSSTGAICGLWSVTICIMGNDMNADLVHKKET